MFQRVSFPSVAVQMIFVLSLSMPLIAQSSPTIGKATSIASESSDAVISQTSSPSPAQIITSCRTPPGHSREVHLRIHTRFQRNPRLASRGPF